MCVQVLCDLGYSATDIITTLFRVTKNADAHEFVKLEFLRVGGGDVWAVGGVKRGHWIDGGVKL